METQFFKTVAKCPECQIIFKFAVTAEERRNVFALEIPCPRWYDEITGAYEDKVEEYELEDLDDDFDDFFEDDRD